MCVCVCVGGGGRCERREPLAGGGVRGEGSGVRAAQQQGEHRRGLQVPCPCPPAHPHQRLRAWASTLPVTGAGCGLLLLRAAQIVLYDQGSGSTEVALVRYSTYQPKEGGSKAKPINQFDVSGCLLLADTARCLPGEASVS